MDPSFLFIVQTCLLGSVMDGMMYGVHFFVFSQYILLHRRQKTQFFSNPINIANASLFLLCTGVLVVDVWLEWDQLGGRQFKVDEQNHLLSSFYALSALVDFIAQTTLIYRCWVIWDRRFGVIFFPAFLSLSALATQFVVVILPNIRPAPSVVQIMLAAGTYGYSASLAVNMTITILIVSRIWYISRAVTRLVGDENPGFRSKGPYSMIMAMLLESGLAIFLGQLLWTVLYALNSEGFNAIQGGVTQLYGMTPSIIMIRVLNGSSYQSTVVSSPSQPLSFLRARKDTLGSRENGATSTEQEDAT